MRKILKYLAFFLLLSNYSFAEVMGKTLSKVSEKISEKVLSVIPGEGVTEFDIELSDQDNNDPRFNLLLLRNLNKQQDSNLFTQFGLHTQDVGTADLRYIANLGLGYRFLSDDQSFMFGGNIFYDRDLGEEHERGSIGLEAKAGILEFNLNKYEDISLQQIVDGNKEQVLGGVDYKVSSQVPYLPWAKFNFTGYEHEKDLAAVDTKGNIYALEMALTPSLTFEAGYDDSRNTGGDDTSSAKLTFSYPPKTNQATLADGFSSNEAFYKKDMTSTLTEKVRRNNNIVVETQGAIVITSQ